VRAVVTGGAGFIGSHLVDALVERGDEVTVIDDLSTGRRAFLNEAARLEQHDIRQPFSVDADVVFHLAAQADVGTSMQRPGFDAEVNVVGTVNTLETARAAGAEIVFASTGGAIYGDVQRPATEEDPRLPLSAYGIAKLAAEAYVEGWNRIHDTSHAVLRFANVYGPRQSATLEGGVVAIFMERLARGEETLVFGDGEQSRDYVYVGDVAHSILAAVGRGGVYNVGTGVETTVNELHRLCARIAGSGQEPRHVETRTGDVRRSVLDPSRAERELGWRPETPLEEGLRLTWDSIEGHVR
jgi:UDP-glucose 4-epimerase